MTTTKKTAERLIKKYPNRRLYDTETSTYITLTDVKQLVLEQEDFKVVDAKSNEDLTRSILLQIILEEESGGVPMFSSSMLSQIIRFYGHAMQGMMGTYLEKNIQAFIDIQNKLADQSKNLYEGNAMNPEVWSQFMNMQAPMMQGMMTSYIEQSKNMFVQMQEQMQNQGKVDVQHVPVQAAGRVGAGKSNGFAAGRPRRATRRASVPRSSAARAADRAFVRDDVRPPPAGPSPTVVHDRRHRMRMPGSGVRGVVQSIEIPSLAKEHRGVSCLVVRVRAGARTMSGAARCGVEAAFSEMQ